MCAQSCCKLTPLDQYNCKISMEPLGIVYFKRCHLGQRARLMTHLFVALFQQAAGTVTSGCDDPHLDRPILHCNMSVQDES